MRRCLHACLIGVLTLSLSMDTARACWYLRQACRQRPACVVTCVPSIPPMACVETTPWVVVETWDGCGCGAAEGAVVTPWIGAAVVAVPAAAAGVVDTAELPVAPGEPVAAPAPTLAEPAEHPAATADLPTLQPASEPVQQTTAVAEADAAKTAKPEAAVAEEAAEPEPMAEPADAGATAGVAPVEPMAAEPPAAAEPPVVEEPNIFEEVDRAGEPTGEADPVAPSPAAAAAGPRSEAAPAAADTGEGSPSEPPAVDGTAEPTVEEPAAEEPAVEDPFDAAGSTEPARRWIDRTGGYAVVGTLVAVGEDGTCELAAAGRRLRVSMEALSDHDREYARRAATRLTATRAAKPTTGETAGL